MNKLLLMQIRNVCRRSALLVLRLGWVLTALALLAACSGPARLAVPEAVTLDQRDSLRHWFFDDQQRLQPELGLNFPDTVADLYAANGYQPLWLDRQQLSAAGELLRQSLQETSADNIYPYAYHLSAIDQHLRVAKHNEAALHALDLLLTDAFVAYYDDVFSTRLYPTTMVKARASEPPRATRSTHHDNLVTVSAHLRDTEARVRLLQQMTPDHPEYLRLREALHHYQSLAAAGQWRPLTDGPTLEMGMHGPRVGELRDLLVLYGDHPPTGAGLLDRLLNSTSEEEQLLAHHTFDTELEASLKRFQRRHGHTADGRAGPITRRLLNVAPQVRVQQIAFNMKRWRELPRQLGDRYIWVNLTDYSLQLIRGDDIELDMRIIIGSSYRPTPVFQKEVNTLVFNPYWNVPRRLAVNDILPEARKDPQYLTRKHIRVFENWESTTPIPVEAIDWSQATARNFRYLLRQDPGPHNSLGHIKFVIPDSDAIYLHDTNDRSLFARGTRAMSSGCIRVEKPLELAVALLEGSRWDRQQIQRTINSGKTRHVRLLDDVPIYLFYATAWVDEDKRMQFRDDIYGLDKVL